MLKWLLLIIDKKIIPLSSLEYMATSETNKKYLIPMIDARRNNVFAGIYDSELNCVENDSLVDINKLLDNRGNDYELVSYDNIKNSIKPIPNVLKIINKHINDEGINPHELKPNYLKLTEAEEKRLAND